MAAIACAPVERQEAYCRCLLAAETADDHACGAGQGREEKNEYCHEQRRVAAQQREHVGKRRGLYTRGGHFFAERVDLHGATPERYW